MDSIIALNILDNNILINKSAPILFYWDGELDPIEIISNNDDFINYINNNIAIDNYSSITINYCYFEASKEEYNDNMANLQNVFSIDKLSDNIIDNCIKSLFINLCKKALDNDNYTYEFTDDFSADLQNMYNDIKNKWKDKITFKTVLNYFRKELNTIYKLNSSNIDFILTKINNNVIEK